MDKYQDILRHYWGYDDFRGIQRDIIESIGAGRDTLGLMPTGGGKSITFQVPALSMSGTCIVITPLISLMKDQVDNLRHRNILAEAVHSGLGHEEIVRIMDNCIYGDIKFLYVSPERLTSQFFLTKLKNVNVSFITVDEAHCISQWGYDFRPAYLRIADVRRLFPKIPVLALTATATPDVVSDIQQRLAFREVNVFRMSFRRSNIAYVVRKSMDIMHEIVHILNSVPGSAIIYTMSRRRTQEISLDLRKNGISADFYHAGLDIAVKTKRQQDWQEGITRVIVATNAFGMGIDKPDVRLVIHADVPSSIEAYFQEAGRAGRDGLRAYAVLLTNRTTPGILRKRISQSFPSKDFIRDVYEHLAYYFEIGVGMGRDHSFIFSLRNFCLNYHYYPASVDAALRILSNAGYIHYETDPDDHTRVKFIVSRDELYALEHITPEEDLLLNNLLRFYTGLFTDYVYINEQHLSEKQGVSPEHIYMLLSNLRRKHIIQFVPPRTDPKITYLIDRVDGCDVKISKDVYDHILKVAENHILAMINYIEDTNTCRQTNLVRYFGEEGGEDCGHCEICLERKKTSSTATSSKDDICKAILQLLSDGKRHLATEVTAWAYPQTDIANAITALLENGTINSDSIHIWI